MDAFGRTLVIIGLALATAGALLWWNASRGRGGLLPGDIFVERGSFRVFFPIVTCVVASLVLTLLIRLFRR